MKWKFYELQNFSLKNFFKSRLKILQGTGWGELSSNYCIYNSNSFSFIPIYVNTATSNRIVTLIVNDDTSFPLPSFQWEQTANITARQFRCPVWLNKVMSPSATGPLLVHCCWRHWPAASLRARAHGLLLKFRSWPAVPTKMKKKKKKHIHRRCLRN